LKSLVEAIDNVTDDGKDEGEINKDQSNQDQSNQSHDPVQVDEFFFIDRI
jgi:hypothetical protein